MLVRAGSFRDNLTAQPIDARSLFISGFVRLRFLQYQFAYAGVAAGILSGRVPCR
jgi:hypothetical protein